MPRPKKAGRYLNLYLDRAFRMYMNAMNQNPEQIMKERRSD